MSTRPNSFSTCEETLRPNGLVYREVTTGDKRSESRIGPRSASMSGKRIQVVHPATGERQHGRKRARIDLEEEGIPVEQNPNCSVAWPMIAFRFKSRTVLLKRRSDYAETITSIKREFGIQGKQVRLHAKIQEFGTELLEISAEVWPEIASRLKTVSITKKLEEGAKD